MRQGHFLCVFDDGSAKLFAPEGKPEGLTESDCALIDDGTLTVYTPNSTGDLCTVDENGSLVPMEVITSPEGEDEVDGEAGEEEVESEAGAED